jgi:radical SAM protein with 4Fe4S-binding SPASM domain
MSAFDIVVRDVVPPHNWGSAYQFRKTEKAMCSVVSGFRSRVLQITWRGDVIPCCFDYNADVVFGNLIENELETIFNSSAYLQFITDHIKGRIMNYLPCRSCNKCFII